jgi:hypothetical protein
MSARAAQSVATKAETELGVETILGTVLENNTEIIRTTNWVFNRQFPEMLFGY